MHLLGNIVVCLGLLVLTADGQTGLILLNLQRKLLYGRLGIRVLMKTSVVIVSYMYMRRVL